MDSRQAVGMTGETTSHHSSSIQIPYPIISFSRVDVPILVSLASSGTANTAAPADLVGACDLSRSRASRRSIRSRAVSARRLIPGHRTRRISPTSQAARSRRSPSAHRCRPGDYYIGFQMSTNNNSSIGTATTQLGNYDLDPARLRIHGVSAFRTFRRQRRNRELTS